jgi:DNA polymerase-1
VSATLPLFARLERGGFDIDPVGIAPQLVSLEQKMSDERRTILAGRGSVFLKDVDLVGAPSVAVARAIRQADGSLPDDWRPRRIDEEKRLLQRYVLFTNPRALAVKRLRKLDAIAWWMHRIDGRDHVRSMQDPGATGRWQARHEALQSIPKRGPEAKALLKHFVAPPGHMFVASDFAAFEPRLLAHLSKDPVLVAGCAKGSDIYTEVMRHLRVTDRDVAKKALLGFMYGKSPMSLAAELPLPYPVGHAINAALESLLATAVTYRDGVHATDRQSARSMFGWRRQRALETPAKFARRAFNLRMQGTAADLLRKLLRALDVALPARARVVHQDFDAVTLVCPTEDVAAVEALLKATMEKVETLNVPLVAKTTHGATLADLA